MVLRDSYGKVQLLIKDKKLQEIIKETHFESTLQVCGVVQPRPLKDVNPAQPNGTVEVLVDKLIVLNPAKARLPILNREFQQEVNEVTRLQYRYLDLRRPRLQHNLRARSKLINDMRAQLLSNFQFIEVETPTLFKATPGGAQEFIVPTRFAGAFYSLVQSPQQFKQLLMIGGIDRYFQVARCYRDEGTKADRQPEFTQLDIEMSYTTMGGVMELIEDLLVACWPNTLPKIEKNFELMSYDQAMELYGCDKPDMRRADIRIEPISRPSDGSTWYKLMIPADYDSHFVTRNFVENDLSVQLNTLNFTGQLRHCKRSALCFQELPSDLGVSLDTDGGHPNDYIWLASAASKADCERILGRIRAMCIDQVERHRVDVLGEPPKFACLWVVDFPLFLRDETTGQLEPSHHPFTAPKNPEDSELIYAGRAHEVMGQNFDLVINGVELGGGSIRITDHVLQRYILEQVLGCDNNSSLEYFFEALSSGCPPHGGFAIGLDRLMALLLGESTLREVIAFPKAAHGKDLMAGSPGPISAAVKSMYHVETIN